LGWYNWARFGSVVEFGMRYQMGYRNLAENSGDIFNLAYVPQNLYNYFFTLFDLQSQFPFLSLKLGMNDPIYHAIVFPKIYTSQFVTGLLYTAPFVIFALVPLVIFLFSYFKKQPLQTLADGNAASTLYWLVMTLGGAFFMSFGVLMMYFWVGIRFFEDFMPSLTLLSVIGFWQGYSLALGKSYNHKMYAGLGIVLAVISITISTLLAISINDARFVIIQFFSVFQ
jgi:hypothetical protein